MAVSPCSRRFAHHIRRRGRLRSGADPDLGVAATLVAQRATMTHDRPEQPSDPGPRLELSFPCEWRYRVIGADAARLRAAMTAIAGDAAHEIRDGNTSSTQKYVSLELVMTVRDDEHRLDVFARLAEHEDVKFVL
jgi:putative lipoic acid-binding regulatory protein